MKEPRRSTSSGTAPEVGWWARLPPVPGGCLRCGGRRDVGSCPLSERGSGLPDAAGRAAIRAPPELGAGCGSGSRDDQLAAGLASVHYPVRVGDLLEGEHPRGLGLVGARLGLGDDFLERDRGDRVGGGSYLEAAEEAELHAAGHVCDRQEVRDGA